MISWYDGVTWDRRAYWGEDLVWAAGKHSIGSLPAAGEWVRLEIPAATVGLAGKSVKGMKFSVHSGKVWFDRVGLEPGTIAARSTSPSWSDRLRELGTLLTYGRTSQSTFRYQSTPSARRAFVAPQSTATPRRYSLYTPELNLLAETAMTTADSPSIAYEYIWFGGQPVAQVTTATNEIAWYFNDHLGTPVLQTDAAANVVWRVEREPYGTTYLLRTGADRHQPLSFPRQEEGVESDVAYNVFRWYRGGWGRYTQSDSIGLRRSTNLFAYTAANPGRYIDPYGLCLVELRFAPLGPMYYHAYITTTDNSGTTFFRGGPGANSWGGGSSGSGSTGSSSGSSGSSTGSCCQSKSGSGSSNSTSPGASPGRASSSNGPYGSLTGISGPYTPSSIDYPRPGENQQSITLVDDGSPCECNACFQNALDEITKSDTAYNPFTTNSNAVVHALLERCGFDASEPPYWSPGWSTPLP